MNVLNGLEPRRVFEIFEHLSSVPHGSGNTKAISDLCVQFARERGLDCLQDGLNNVIVRVPASPGYEAAETVILQGHLDMVCAKSPEDPMDMSREPIRLATDGEWVFAQGTSLGGDDLIAVAMALAIAEDKTLPHPALECLFTVDEETGMNGAVGLDASVLHGRKMINLDSEAEGYFTAGCAGGADVRFCFPARREEKDPGEAGYRVTVSGLLGGHSGGEIHKERGNSHQLTARLLHFARREMPLRLCKLWGGEFDNVIPGKTTAEVRIPAGSADKFIAHCHRMEEEFREELAASDPGVTVSVEPAESEAAPVCAEDTRRMLDVLIALPYGVQNMSMALPGLTQTSLSMGVLRLEEDGLRGCFFVRSSMESQKMFTVRRVELIVSAMGGTFESDPGYPGWAFRRESPLRELALRSYRELTGKEAQVFATHGGLECGLLIDKMPGLDCISFGPDMEDIHSVRERLSVPSVGRTYALVCSILKNCK